MHQAHDNTHNQDQTFAENTRYLELQKKARSSFKKLLKLNGKLTNQGLAFFYLQNTPAASSGNIFKPMTQLRTQMKQFWCTWINYNQALPSGPQFPSHVIKPTVLVVADDIFTMGDKLLMQPARLAVPNTLKESSLVLANAANH
jgi:hypothetical protein